MPLKSAPRALLMGMLIPAALDAQITQAEFKRFEHRMSEIQPVVAKFIAAAKGSDAGSIGDLLMPGATFADRAAHQTPLSITSIADWAKQCQPIYANDPRMHDGRLELPTEEIEVIWQCDAGSSVPSTRMVARFAGNKIASMAMTAGPAVITVAPAPRR